MCIATTSSVERRKGKVKGKLSLGKIKEAEKEYTIYLFHVVDESGNEWSVGPSSHKCCAHTRHNLT